MSSTDPVPRKTAQDRAQAQRDRILRAAQSCFIKHGFQAASMANIAEAAEMSAGLIYRYFDSKDAIILAIIDRQLQEKVSDIATLQSRPDLNQRIRDLFVSWQQGADSVMNAALFLEMSAQATRDPQIARALAHSDQITGALFRDWVGERAAGEGVVLDDQQIQQRVLVLQCFIEGLAVRAVREPQFDVEVVSAAVGQLLTRLFSKPQVAEAHLV